MIDVIYPPNSILPESNYEGQKRHAHARLRSPHKTPFLVILVLFAFYQISIIHFTIYLCDRF